EADIQRKDGIETRFFDRNASPDDLRIRVADPFSPFVLQEEIGANLRAVDLDLRLMKLMVGTRAGFGFRQGFLGSMLIVDRSDMAGMFPTVHLHEADDYSTLGPVVGATATVTFARWLFGSSAFGMMIPVQNTSSEADNTLASYPATKTELGFGEKLLIDFSGT